MSREQTHVVKQANITVKLANVTSGDAVVS